jgi:hypothetical protein
VRLQAATELLARNCQTTKLFHTISAGSIRLYCQKGSRCMSISASEMLRCACDGLPCSRSTLVEPADVTKCSFSVQSPTRLGLANLGIDQYAGVKSGKYS